jgi:hypothetical protein
MYIQDEQLRTEIKKILAFKKRNQHCKGNTRNGNKFHFFQLTNFLEGKDVSLSTLKKIDNYIKSAV